MDLQLSPSEQRFRERLCTWFDAVERPAGLRDFGATPTAEDIEPARAWQLINLRELWHYRELILILAWRDVKVRYKQTLLGAAWAVLQPALMMVVFTIFFGRLAHVSSDGVDYSVFVYAGLFGTGSLIYGRISQSILWGVLFVISGVVLMRVVMRVWSSDARLAETGGETSAIAARRPCTKAVILAAGRGTRMQAANNDVALTAVQIAAADAGIKAMIPVGRPFLDYSLSALGDAGFTEICIVVAGGDHTIRDRYGGATIPTRFRVSFATQLAPDGSADALLAAEEFTAGEPFVVLNSDNYYPRAVLESLRTATEPAGIGFSREGLLRHGDIPAERIAAYAILDVGADGYIRRIVEKPDPSAIATLGSATEVSMNCWHLTSEFFRACRDVPPSTRNELELPAAVQYAIEVLGMRFRVIHVDAPVLDLSHRADIPGVTARLKGVAVRL